MNYYTIAPTKELASFVRFFWVLTSEASVAQPYVHRSMADGCTELLFHYQGQFNEILNTGQQEKSFTAGIHGPSGAYRRFTIAQNFGMFGVYLYPFAIPALFTIPAAVVSNQMPDLRSLLGKEGEELEEKVSLASNNTQRVNIVSAYLLHKIKNATTTPTIFAAVQAIIQSKGIVNLARLADQTCLSKRQFERNFKNSAGFSPKLFSRIIRFQATLNEYGNSGKSLTEIGHACGYYDQSHFIHDFKEFSGYHPSVYFRGKMTESNYKDS